MASTQRFNGELKIVSIKITFRAVDELNYGEEKKKNADAVEFRYYSRNRGQMWWQWCRLNSKARAHYEKQHPVASVFIDQFIVFAMFVISNGVSPN